MRRTPRVVPPVYFLAGLASIFVLNRWAPVRELLPGWLALVGLMPLALGIALGFSATTRFHRAGTPLRPGTLMTAFVQEGPYRFTRNPMYLGMTLILLGVALFVGSASPLLVPPAFLALIHLVFVRREERWMEEAFGESYRAYCRRTRRWW
jgi:protein-S-isoprenylcysteine O-methyltransferase Ste14